MIIYFWGIAFCFFLFGGLLLLGFFLGGREEGYMFTDEHWANILTPPATPKNPSFGVQICQDLGIGTPVADESLDLFNPDVRTPTTWNM